MGGWFGEEGGVGWFGREGRGWFRSRERMVYEGGGRMAAGRREGGRWFGREEGLGRGWLWRRCDWYDCDFKQRASRRADKPIQTGTHQKRRSNGKINKLICMNIENICSCRQTLKTIPIGKL